MYTNLNKNIQIISVLSLTIILVFTSFTLINAQAPNTKAIKIGLNIRAPNFLAYIAEEIGYFKKNNVDVNLTLFQNYNDAIKAYSNGELDGIFVVYSDAIIQDSWGIDTKVVYNIDSSSKADVIVGNGII